MRVVPAYSLLKYSTAWINSSFGSSSERNDKRIARIHAVFMYAGGGRNLRRCFFFLHTQPHSLLQWLPHPKWVTLKGSYSIWALIGRTPRISHLALVLVFLPNRQPLSYVSSFVSLVCYPYLRISKFNLVWIRYDACVSFIAMPVNCKLVVAISRLLRSSGTLPISGLSTVNTFSLSAARTAKNEQSLRSVMINARRKCTSSSHELNVQLNDSSFGP